MTGPSPRRAVPARPRWRGHLLWLWLPLPLPLALLALWQLAAQLHWLPPQTLPAPARVLHTLTGLVASGELPAHLAISLRRLLLGLLAGAALGVALGAAMGRSRRLDALLQVPLSAALQIPTLAWIPLFMLCFGIGETLKLVVIVKAVCIPILLHARIGLRDTPPGLREVADMHGLHGWRRWRRLYLPAATPALLAGLRLAVADAWLSLLVVELLASSEGIGYLIVDGRQLFQLDVVMSGIVCIGAIGVAMDAALAALERRAVRWPRPALAALPPPAVLPLRWRHSGNALLLALLLAWQIGAGLSAQAQAAGATPLQVLAYGYHALLDGSLPQALLASLARYAAGLAIGGVAGGVIGIALGWHRAIDRLAGPTLRFIRHVAIFAWLPLLTAWAGLGEGAKVVFVAITTALPMLTAVAAGMCATPPALQEVAAVLGLSPWQRLVRLRWPAALPQVFAGLHLCLVHAWLATIGAEYFLASSTGIGSLMVNAGQTFHMDVVIAAMLAIGAIGAVLNHTGRWLEHRATGWRHARSPK